MATPTDRVRQPIFTAEVDEALEFDEDAQNNSGATSKQPTPSGRTQPIFSARVDVVHEFHEVASPDGTSTNGHSRSKVGASTEPSTDSLGERR